MDTNNIHHDDYLPCKYYMGSTPRQEGIFKFMEAGKFYCSFLDNGRVILRSEGYTSEGGRENGIVSILKNMENESQYKIRKSEEGTWSISLEALNHKEIARSCDFDTEAEALALLPGARARAREISFSVASPMQVDAPVMPAAILTGVYHQDDDKKKNVSAVPPAINAAPATGGFQWWWLLALLLLIALFFWWKSCDQPVAEAAPVIETPAAVVVDTDGDGISDDTDKCPKVAGIAGNLGCPEMILYYLRDEGELSADDKANLDKVVTFLNNHPDIHLILEGHTSTLGDADYNQKLSEKRVNTSVAYLVEKGIDGGRLKAVGFGEQYPVGDNETEEGRAKSRRTVIRVEN